MTEVLFYHLQNMALENVLPPLLEKSLERGWRVVVQSTSQERVDALDAHLCDLKEMQIRDGLHVFGRTPQQAQRNDLLVSIARLPRSESKPQDAGPQGRTWYARGQNFIVAYSEAQPGATFERQNQPDEYVVLVPNAGTAVTIRAEQSVESVPGESLAIVPPGRSTVSVPSGSP